MRKSSRGNKSNEVMGKNSKAMRKVTDVYPKLHLFGNKNALEYFSDDSENADEGIGLNQSIEHGDGLLLATSSRSTVGNTRTLARRKNLIAAPEASPAEPNILSNILDTMDQWHSMSQPSQISRIIINRDGTLGNNNRNQTQSPATTNSDIVQAPLYQRGGGNGAPTNNTGGDSTNFGNSNGFRSNSTTDNGHYTNSSAVNYSFNRSTSASGNFQSHGNSELNSSAENSAFDGSTMRNRQPFQQRDIFNNRRSINDRSQHDENHPMQGLYDGEDIAPPTRKKKSKMSTDKNFNFHMFLLFLFQRLNKHFPLKKPTEMIQRQPQVKRKICQ